MERTLERSGKIAMAKTKSKFAFKDLKEALAVPEPEKGKDYREAWSTFQPGFGIRVLPGGNRVWLVRYKKDGAKGDTKERLLSIPVDDKRAHWLKAMELAADKKATAGGDGSKDSSSIASVAEGYMRDREGILTKDSVKGYATALSRLSDKAQITPMSKLNDNFWTAEYHTMKQKTETGAKASLRLVHALYVQEVKKGNLIRNPLAYLASTLKLYARKKPLQKWISDDNLPKVWKALNLLHAAVRDYLLVCLFTGWRKSICGSLKWADIDKLAQTILVEPEQRGNKAHITIPMPIPDILWAMVFEPRLATSEQSTWVIPSTKLRGKPLHEPRGSFDILETATGLKLSAHPFRKTFITHAERTVGLLRAAFLAMHSPDIPFELRQTGEYVMLSDELMAASNKTAQAIYDKATSETKVYNVRALPQVEQVRLN